MDMDTYQREAMSTASGIDLTIGVLGLCGEAGECAEHVKKHLAQGHELDCDKIISELGDVLWYIALVASAISAPLSEVARRNNEKLRKRYPAGFSVDASVNRKAGDQ